LVSFNVSRTVKEVKPMHNKRQSRRLLFRTISRTATVALAMAIIFVLTVVATQSVQAQTFNVIHNFTGGGDGAHPVAGLTIDRSGSLYGTTWDGGMGYGTVFRLASTHSNWIFSPLYSFAGGNDGDNPGARVVFGPDGRLYGTTEAGGGGILCFFGAYIGCGTVFNLRPPATACKTALCPWSETVLYRYSGGVDGGYANAEVVFDPTGAIYSTTAFGGRYGHCNAAGEACGTAYKLTRSGDSWNEAVLYNFGQVRDATEPLGGVIFDNAGNLYGTTYEGGYNYGTVFQLMPSGSGWTETILYQFNGGSPGEYPVAGVIIDNLGILYGATTAGGTGGGGTVFELTPSSGNWIYTVLHSFTGGAGPEANLTMDAAGNLYGTTVADGTHGYGSVFKLTRTSGWTYTSLHDFTGGSDGGNPISNIVFDANGNLYGTTSKGGTSSNCYGGCGVVWEITP
jgi:uncharacterized repeat protein (TIGR03803 family)